jgi:HTH-type transcriptional regulator/antitoxin HigA
MATAEAAVDAPYEPNEVLPPGETLRETLEALDMSQTQLALRTDLSVKHINQIIQGQAALTHETAIALERATGVPARFWNALEAQYRDHRSRVDERASLDSMKGWLQKMPVDALRKAGVVSATRRDPGALIQQLLTFFGVSSVDAWQQVWASPSADFLQSSSFVADTAAVAAWLRLGEIEAAQIACKPYDKHGLRGALPELRSLTVEEPSVFWPKLRSMSAEVGIAVVLVPEVTGARASGATRWVSPNKAIIQLSNRGKRNDKFWFAFFHEVGHVLLHGKREVFVEDKIGMDGGRLAQEAEANDFAGNLLIPNDYVEAMSALTSDAAICDFAQTLKIAPGIVAGRLQRDRQGAEYKLHNSLFQKFEIVD